MRKFRREKDVKDEIKKLLTKHGWFHWMPPANGFGKGGTSDHNAIKGERGAGQFMAIEAKHTKTGKGTSTLQRDFLFNVEKNGGFAFVVNENNIMWLAVFLQAYDNAAAAVAQALSEGKSEQEALIAAEEHNVMLHNAQAILVEGWLQP